LSHKIWKRPENLISGQEYAGNQLVAKLASEKGFSAIIDEYVYIHPENVENTFDIIPNSSEHIHGIGIDLGGGVGCISSTLAKRKNVKKIYCIELVEEAVTMCQPIVKREILKENDNKVISVVGDFDDLNLENNSIDFAVSWDSMHHSMNLVKTLKECKRVLKKNGIFIIVDRAHNNSTPDSEIERMLNIVYDENFLTKFYRPKGTILTRKENGEHEHRFFEWDNFFEGSGFKLIDSVVIKTESDENRKLKNDNNVNEIFVNYNLGAFGNRKVAFVLRSI
jgi:ubiquinone/menaquinone biosynthesis C-methylase UbiE